MKKSVLAWSTLVSLGATTALGFSGAGVAAAATAGPSTPGARVGGAVVASGAHLRMVPAGKVTPTTYEGGYYGPATADASQTATFVVPTITCKAKTTAPDFVTFDLYGDGASGDFDGSGGIIQMQCTDGVPSYSASVLTDDGFGSGFAVNPGDVISETASANASADDESITDESGGGTASATGTGFTPSGAQTSMQGGFGSDGFPGFTDAAFSGVTIDGASLKSDKPTQVEQVSSAGKPEIKSSKIGKDGESFTDTFVTG